MDSEPIHGRKYFKELPLSTVWRYGYFREYILGLGRNKQYYAEMLSNFPKQIELNRGWHNCLNQLRRETSDNIERYIFIGTDNTRRVVLLPNKTAVGESRSVPLSAIHEHESWGISKGVEEFVGSIHSHPHRSKSTWDRVKNALSIKHTGKFSVADMYNMLNGDPYYIMALAEENANVFAFRTHETSRTNLGYLHTVSPESFVSYWYKKHGMQTNGEYVWRKEGDKPTEDDLWNVVRDIAQTHSIALYRGLTDFSIIREFPPITPVDQK